MSSTNGKAHLPKTLVLEDPLARVLETGSRVPSEWMVAGAIVLHLAGAGAAVGVGLYEDIHAWQRGIRDIVSYALSQYEMEVVKDTPPPPPPEPDKEKPPEPEPEKSTPPPPQANPEAPPPPPTEAAKVLTAAPDPNEPVDLTGNTFVTGNGDTFKGGQTSTQGKGDKPVYNPAAAHTGVVGGTGTAPAPPPPPPPKEDRSRVAGLLGSSDWNDCPFPGEADAEQIDRQAVLIKVHVRPDGSPESVDVVQDPGHGFGREARKCAMRKKFSPGLDPSGNPIPSITKPFRVRFER